MDKKIRYRDKVFGPKEIDEIREVIASRRERSRWSSPESYAVDRVELNGDSKKTY
jgi:hypothetical protein